MSTTVVRRLIDMPALEAPGMNLIGLCSTLFLALLTIILPRRLAFLPILISVCFLTYGQVSVVMGFNFTILRVLVFVGWVRILIRREIRKINVNEIDNAIIYWLIFCLIANTIREQTSIALVNRLGFIYNGFGLYFFFRMLIMDISDIERVIKVLVLLSVPLSLALLIEKMTFMNVFSILGGVPEFAWVRDETVRAQGPFGHAILAGTFGAVLMPLSISLRYGINVHKKYGLTGMLTATIIMLCAASGVPIFSYFCGVVGMMLWRFRAKMRVIRWSILLLIIFLHMIMKAPVWYLLSRASDVTGGTGWHRAYLIDQAIAYFEEWWLLGTGYTRHWMPYGLAADPNHSDITNQFILQGIDGGVLSMLLFISIIVFCFKRVGNADKHMEDHFVDKKMVTWSLGASLLVMVVSFFGVAYYDQMIVVCYLLCAMIACISSNKMELKRV
jgi:hypothetical protein